MLFALRPKKGPVKKWALLELRAGRPGNSQARTPALRSAGVLACEFKPRLAACALAWSDFVTGFVSERPHENLPLLLRGKNDRVGLHAAGFGTFLNDLRHVRLGQFITAQRRNSQI